MTPDTPEMRRLWDLQLRAGGAGLVLLLSAGLLIATGLVFGWLAAHWHPSLGAGGAVAIGVAALLALLLAVPAHEGVHALAFVALGKRPQFGAAVRSLMPYFYVTCPGSRFSRDQYLAALLAPLVVLDLVALLLLVPPPTAVFALALLVINTSSSAGDLWMASLLVQSPRWIEVEDTRGGFTAWAPPTSAGAATLRPPIGLNPRVLAWVAAWLIGSFVLLEVVIFVLLVMVGSHPGTRVQVGPVVLAESLPPGRHGVRVQLLPLAIVVAVVGAALTAAAARLRTRRSRGQAAGIKGKRSGVP